MSNFILIAVCFLAGFLLRKSGVLAKGSHQGINVWIIYVALPAATLKYLPHIVWSTDLIIPLITPLICWFGAWLLAELVSKRFQFDRKTKAAFWIVTGLGNTSFVGFPLISAYYGEKYLSIAAVTDQMSFFVLAVFASIVAMQASGTAKADFKTISLKLLKFPPFIVIILALVLPHFISFEPITPLVSTLAATLSPLALFSVGLQFELGKMRDVLQPILAASLYKLILSPLIILGLAFAFQTGEMQTKISVFEASMGTMISAGILNDQFGLNPRLSNLIVFLTILLSFVTSGIWYYLLEILV
ncbi:AEC family transporter [Fluviicola sp.]|uniref:AEC family transporter n=1 Tax=Fluviicola sp. TaxID=1917219 RepID=UPI0031D5A18A